MDIAPLFEARRRPAEGTLREAREPAPCRGGDAEDARPGLEGQGVAETRFAG